MLVPQSMKDRQDVASPQMYLKFGEEENMMIYRLLGHPFNSLSVLSA